MKADEIKERAQTDRAKLEEEIARLSRYQMGLLDGTKQVVAYDKEAGMVKHYRVDKMKDIFVSDEKQDKPAEKIDLSAYSGRMFGMFGGELTKIGLKCPKDKIGILIDRFGQDIKITGTGSDEVTVHTEVVLSGQFYGWIASVGPGIRLVSPQTAVNGMKDFLKENLAAY